ncbi:MAG: DUF975 family protein [Eggerthellaceae bacterium]|nr:DUF975 family protein [Eggerthellaceae bacterium]
MWTRKELKDKAKVSFRANYWKAVLIALLIMVLGGSFGSFNSGTTGTSRLPELAALTNVSDSASQQGYDYSYYYYDDSEDYFFDDYEDLYAPYDSSYGDSNDNDFSGAEALLAAFGILVIVLIACALIAALNILIFNPLLVGARRFFVRNLNQKAEAKEMAYSFDSGNFVEIIKTMFFRDLFVILWSLLLIVPGIVKAYEYRMIPYLLAEDPTMTKDVAFAESKRMMTGQKWDTFVLDLSFLGWNILSALTLGILGIFYVGPYQAQTNAALYEKLRYGLPAPTQQAFVGADQPPMPPTAGMPTQPYANAGFAVGAVAGSGTAVASEATAAVESVGTAVAQTDDVLTHAEQDASAATTAPAVAGSVNAPASQAYWTAQAPATPTTIGTASQPPIAPYAAIASDPYPQAAAMVTPQQVPADESDVASEAGQA